MKKIFPKDIKQNKVKFPEIDITNPELGKDWEGHFRDMRLHSCIKDKNSCDCSRRSAHIHGLEDYKLGEHNCVLLPVSELLDKYRPGWTYEDSQELFFKTLRASLIELNGMVNWYEWNW